MEITKPRGSLQQLAGADMHKAKSLTNLPDVATEITGHRATVLAKLIGAGTVVEGVGLS